MPKRVLGIMWLCSALLVALAPASAGQASWDAVVAAREALERHVEQGDASAARVSASALTAAAAASLAAVPDAALDPKRRARAERHVEKIGRLSQEVAAGDPEAAGSRLRVLDSVLVMLRRQLPEAQPAAPREVYGAAQVAEDAVRTLEVVGNEYSYSPSQLVLRAGEATRIEFRNIGGIRHELVIQDPATGESLVYIHTPAHETRSGTFRIDVPGEYPIVCPIEQHAAMGMLGSLRVEP